MADFFEKKILHAPARSRTLLHTRAEVLIRYTFSVFSYASLSMGLRDLNDSFLDISVIKSSI